MRKFFTLFLFSLLCFYGKTQTYTQEFNNFFSGRLNPNYYGSGVAAVLGCADNVLYTYSNGLTATEHVNIMSLSKWTTGAIIMMLEEEGKLELGDKVGKYIQSWSTNGKQDVTIRHLITHTSGVPVQTGFDERTDINLAQSVDSIALIPLVFNNPGSQFYYGSTAYKVVARVAEKIEGKIWKEIFAERLGAVMPTAYYPDNAPYNDENPNPGYGLKCTLNEYANFMKMILRYGWYNGTQIMDSSSIAVMEQQHNFDGGFDNYGLGMHRDSDASGLKQVWHPGASGTFTWINREKKFYGVIFSLNGDNATLASRDFKDNYAQVHLGSNICGSTGSQPCEYNITVSGPGSNVNTGTPVTLTSSCSGQCNGVSYSWSGTGISGSNTGTSVTFNAPSTAGTYTYTLTTSKTGCTNQTKTVQVNVSNTSGSGCVVNKVRLQFRSSPDCCYERLVGAKIQGSNNGGSSWTDLYTFTGNGNGSFQEFTFSNTTSYSSARFVASSTGWGELRELEFYNGTTKLTGTTFGTDNYANAFDGNTATEWHAPSTPGPNNYAGMNFSGCTPTACDFNVTAAVSPSSVTVSGSTSLSWACTGANCSGATFVWSGQGTNGNQTPKPITAPATAGTYTYTMTATKSGCTTKTANAVLTVNPTSGTGCTVNKVRLKFRQSGECCMDRLPGAKIQGSNNGTTWTDLYTFTTNGTGSWQDFPFTNTTAYSSIRFQASSTGWGELYELEFYKGTAKLTGTAFGVGNYANAFDGNLSTDWQVSSNPGTHNHAGLSNLGNCSGSPLLLDMTDPGQINNKLLLSVSPNPSRGTLNAGFYLSRGKKGTIIINDLQGRTIYRQAITGNGQHNEKIYLVNKSSGTFILRLETPTGVEVRKINITR